MCIGEPQRKNKVGCEEEENGRKPNTKGLRRAQEIKGGKMFM